MKFYEKKVKYFKFFEDSKILELDELNEKLAIVFLGKENLIHIFDAKPYIDYMPIEEKINNIKYEELDEEDKINENKNSKDNSNLINPEDNTNNENNLKEIFNNLTFNIDNNIGKTICSQNQEFIIFNNFNENFSNLNIKNHFKIDNFDINYNSTHKLKDINFNIYKPKIKSKILAIIISSSNVIIGIKFFKNKDNIQHNNTLIAIHDDGNIIIFTMKSQFPSNKTKVNLNKLQNLAHSDLPEDWKSISQVNTGKPIKDFHLNHKCDKIYTLHIDNFIMVWVITQIGTKLNILANFAINITPNLNLTKFLIDRKENFIYSFYHNCIKIFKIMNKPPFPLLYNFLFDKEINCLNENCEKSNLNEYCEKSFLNKNLERTIDNLTPIKPQNGMETPYSHDSPNSLEIYEIFYNDMIDRSELMETYDIDFFNNIQKAEFTHLEKFILIPYFSVKSKKYLLFKFDNFNFRTKIFSDFEFFNQCVNGMNLNLMKGCKSSNSKINFCISPYLYYKNNYEEDNNYYLEDEINLNELNENLYQPVLIINEGILEILNINNNQNICNYKLNYPKLINQDFLNIIWTFNNTIIMSSNKIFMNLIKFAGEEMGVPINPERIEELDK